MSSKIFFITGGSGFIGSALIRHIINHTSHTVVNIDSLTYAGNQDSVTSIKSSSRYHFNKVDICNTDAIRQLFEHHQPNVVIHLAAESHVARSIESPLQFLQTNIIGTGVLLEKPTTLRTTAKEPISTLYFLSAPS